MGYDFITGEDLTDFECGMKVVFALVDVATLGASIIATGGTKIGAKGIAKVVLVEFASNATATTIGCVGNELGLPVGVTMLLSMLGGSYVGIKGSKLAFKTVDGRTFKLADEAIDDISKNLDEVAEGVGKADSFKKIDGGMNKSDFMTPHSEKHLYNPNQVSTKQKTQFGKDIDVAKLREDTMLHPDKIIYNDEQNVIKYVKEYDFNISTPDTPTGSHRVFINLNPKPGKTNRNSQFPFYKGDK